MKYSSEKVFFEERIPEHDIEKHEDECRLGDMSSLHTRLDRVPTDLISEEHIGDPYDDDGEESERNSICERFL